LISIYCSIIGVADARLAPLASSAVVNMSLLRKIWSFTERLFIPKKNWHPSRAAL